MGTAERRRQPGRSAGFYRALGALSGGTLVGQVLLFLAGPVLTRLYDAETFGVFSVVATAAMLGGLIVSLRYELALPICKSDRDAAGVAALCLVLGVANGLVVTAGLWSGGAALARAFSIADEGMFRILLPVTIIVYNLSIVLEYWSLRCRMVALNAWMRIVFVAGQIVPQIVLGFLGANAWGLFVGLMLGHLARCIGFSLHGGFWTTLGSHRPGVRGIKTAATTYWRYPAFAAPANFLLELVQLVPVSLVAVIYDVQTAGFFGLAQRTLEAPIRLLSHSASLLFLSEAPRLPSKDVAALFRTLVVRFAIFGAAGLAPIVLAGPEIFAFVFGAAWREAGMIAELLVPFQLARFVAGAIGNTLTLYQRTDLQLLTAATGVLALVVAFGCGWLLDLPSERTLLLFALAGSASYVLQLLLSWRVLRVATRTNVTLPPTSSQAA